MAGFNSYKATVLADSPTAYYRLDDTGSSAADSSGNSNGGTLHGTITKSVASLLRGDSDNCMTFDGSTGYISCPTGMIPTGATAWSLECWVKIASVPASGFHTLLGWGNTTGAQQFGVLDLNSNGTTVKFTLSTNSGDISGANISTATIYHIVGTYDGTNTRLYQNGSLVAGPSAFTLNLTQAFASIGSFNGSSSFAAATIDEAAFYNGTALSSTQVSNHYNAGLAITKTLGVRFRMPILNTKTLGVRSRISTKVTKTLGTRSRISTTATKTLGVRFRLTPQIFSGGVALYANGTGTVSYDHFRAIQYPDPSAPLVNVGRATSSVVNWNATVPNGTSLTTYTSLDDGATYQPATVATDIAGISTLLYSTLNIQKKPNAYFRLTESVSPSADSSGNGYSGTWHGTITTQAGPLQGPGENANTAVVFHGSYIDISSVPVTAVTDFAVSAWVYINSFATDSGVQQRIIIDNIDGTNAFQLAIQASNNAFVWSVNDSTGQVITSKQGFSTGVWYHLVGTWVAASRTANLYINGALAANDAGASSYGIGSVAFNIGRRTDGLGHFNGSIAEVMVLNPSLAAGNNDLSALDIAALYNAGLSGIGQAANDSFTADTHTSYTQTFGSGGSGATWTWDTAGSKLNAVGGSKAHLLYNNLWSYDIDLLGDFYQAENSGFIWGYQDANNYYSLVIKDSGASSGANTATINKVVSNVSTQLATTSITFTTQTHHRFHMTMLAGVITVSMDENQILTYTDSSPFPAGLAGLRNDTGTSYIYLLAITPQPVDLSSKFIVSKHVLTTNSPTVTPQLTDHQAFAADPTFGPGVLVPSADYTTTYVSDNVDDLNTKSNYWWQMGPNKNVIFQPRNATNSPWILQSSDILINTLPTVEYSGDLYRNRQTLKGVYDTATFGEIKHGDGQTRTWNVANPVVAVPTITLNGLGVTVGLQGKDTGKQYYFTLNDVAIVQDNSQTILQSTDVLAIQYSGAFGIDFSLDNTGQITDTVSQATLAALDGTDGIVEAVEDVSSQNMNVAAATAYANSLLQRYGSIARTIKFDTLHGGLKPGHNLPIFIPQLNIFDSTFLVVEVNTAVRTVSINGVVQVQYVYTVTASEAAALSSWVKLFSKIMRSVSGSHAKV